MSGADLAAVGPYTMPRGPQKENQDLPQHASRFETFPIHPVPPPLKYSRERLAYEPDMKSHPRTAGFTLLEVMIALAIVGGLLVTLIYTLNYHLGIAERQTTLTIGSMLAKEKMADMERTPGNTKGEFPEPYSDFRYATGIERSNFPGMSEMHVTVSSGKEKVELVELIRNE